VHVLEVVEGCCCGTIDCQPLDHSPVLLVCVVQQGSCHRHVERWYKELIRAR
jgi:hypothetical protein